MIELPAPVVIAQWVLLSGLAVLVIVMYRQLAYLLKLSEAEAEGGGLAIGEPAPQFKFKRWRLTGAGSASERFEPNGVPAVLAFAEPYCKACVEMLVSLERATRDARAAGLRVLVLTDANRRELEAVDAFRTTSLDVALVDRTVTARLYRTSITPYLYGVSAGRIDAKGSAASEAEVQSILAKVLGGSRRDGSPDAFEVTHYNGDQPERSVSTHAQVP
jgi:hypothetical protein